MPKISPKKSFIKPSLFILNPDEKFPKKISFNKEAHDLLILDNSDSDNNSSDLELSEEENENKNVLNDKEETKNNINEEINNKNFNSKQKEFISNLNNSREIINDNSLDNECNNKPLSIFDVLSMNYK